MLRDDKSYVYIFVSADKPYPQLPVDVAKVSTKLVNSLGLTSAYSARDTLLVLQKLLMSVSVKIVISHSVSGRVCNIKSSVVRPLV